MNNNNVFNMTVCIMGILILIIHVINLVFKKEKRKDEKVLLTFFVFTIVHFATYLAFSIIKLYYTSNACIIVFYTLFYIMNNMEMMLLFRYAREYMKWGARKKKALTGLNSTLFVIFIVLDIVNIFTGIFFTAENGVYLRSRTMILSQIYQFVMFSVVFIVAVTNKRLNLREKFAFASYCVLPLIAIVLQNVFKGYAIAYASIVISIEVLFFFVNVQKNIDLAKEEEKNKEAQIKIMLSQIQPHFIYNSLSSISTLIPIDPEKAQTALDDFTEYLRMNLSSLTEQKLIHFECELKHIETYVALEKMRFGDSINMVYDIQTTDFTIPPLTIQPLVENAIKHGILKKIGGGTVTLRVYENANAYVVEVTDDGEGFRINDVNFDGNKHIGLQNIKYRLDKSCKADLKLDSKIGIGTKVTVTFLKER